MSAEIQPVRIFIAYSSRDLAYKDEIRKRLKPMIRAGKVTVWDNYDIEGGADWDAEIREKLESSDLILLLLSPDALDSDYFYEVEAPIALERHKTGKAIAVGVLLRPCEFKYTPFEDFARYELLPKKGYPVTDPHWPNTDAAYLTIFEEIDHLVEKFESLRIEQAQRYGRQREYASKESEHQKQQAAAEVAEKQAERKIRETAEKKKKEAARKRRQAKDAESNSDPFANAMLYIKGGTFNMGETFSDFIEVQPLYNAPPVHYVSVKDFYLSKGSIKQGQWKQIMGDYPSSSFKVDALPVENVSWDEAQAFIKKLNEKTGKQYRLPTEAELEYLASFSLKSKAMLKGMLKYLWEWCQDVWHDKSHGLKDAPTDGSAWDGNDSKRVLRLYSGGDTGPALKVSRRQGCNRDQSSVLLGSIVFRIAR